MYATFHTMTRQRGAATLVVAIILLLAITMMTFFGVRVGVTEQRIAANDVRAKQAMAVAEALVENGIGYLENNKAFIPDAVNTGGWLLATTSPRWLPCTNTTALPCGNGTANVYNSTWLYYTATATQIPSVSDNIIYTAAYTESVSFVTPDRRITGAPNPAVAAYPEIHIIANVTPGTDTLAGSAQVKQIVKSFPFTKTSGENAIASLGTMGLSGNYKIWGNPTGLGTVEVSRTALAPGATPASNYIVIDKKYPPNSYGSNIGWGAGNPHALPADNAARLYDNLDTTFLTSKTNPSTLNISISQGAVFDFGTGPIPTLKSITTSTSFFSNISTGQTAGFSTMPCNDTSLPDPCTPADSNATYPKYALESITVGVRAKLGQNEDFSFGPVGVSLVGDLYLVPRRDIPKGQQEWDNHYRTWMKKPDGTAWTVEDVKNLVVHIKACKGTCTTGMTDIDVSEVWVWFNEYKVRYTVPTLTGFDTVVETGFPLSVRSRVAISGDGSYSTCRNWANTTLPLAETAPYPEWYPGGTTPSCADDTSPAQPIPFPPDALSTKTRRTSDVRANDTTLPEDIFLRTFGMPKAQYQEIKSQAVVLPNCDGLTAGSRGLFWITGDCAPSIDLGTASQPVGLIVEGNIDMVGGRKMYGLLYAFSVPGTLGGSIKLAGGVTIVGALVSDHQVDMGNGTFNMVFSRSVLSNLGTFSASFAKVPGGWLDQL